jgi:hypothetical protein
MIEPAKGDLICHPGGALLPSFLGDDEGYQGRAACYISKWGMILSSWRSPYTAPFLLP